MTTDDRVMAILERANPVPPGELVDVPVGATRYLETALEQRSAPMTVIDPTPTRTADRERPPQRRWPMIAVAASVVAILVASIALIVATRDDATVVDTPEPTVPDVTVPEDVGPAPTTVVGPDPAAARAVVDEFFTAYNSGDADDLFALLSDDAVITENYGGAVPMPTAGAEDRAGWELWMSWFLAQGTRLTEPVCGEASDQPAIGTTMRCEYGTLEAARKAAGVEPLETAALLTVVDGNIVELHIGYGSPSFAAVAAPFERWMSAAHPDVPEALFGEVTTRDEAEEYGRARGEWAPEWAAWLEFYGCEPATPCTIPLDRWVAEYDAQCQRLEPPALPDEALVDHMRLMPMSSDLQASQFKLNNADAELVDLGLTAERIAQLQQRRLDAMIELGIDPACHPTFG